MATTKFATFTNKITLVLIHAVLECTLIILLLLNSSFSFLIIKFSQSFGLKPPCLWCSTLHPQNVNSHRHLLCELHSKEVSVLGFCPNHKKLAEIKDLCDDCFSCHLGFQSEVKQRDEDDQKLKCSCCGLTLQNKSCFGTEMCLNQFEGREQDLEFFFDFSGNQLVTIELVDSLTEDSQNVSEGDQDHEFGDYQKARMIQEHQTSGFESMEVEEADHSPVFHAKCGELKEGIETKKMDSITHLVDEETKTPVHQSCVEESSYISHLEIENGLESKNLSENRNEVEEERIPNTPASIKKLLMFERKESRSGESLDGSLMSGMEGGDPINTTEKLKSALWALKAELEEERSASAIAATETMAMITRVQEEKAAMQMEALQYQRMMEEQSEYDQEALQLLNELMIKKEKELEMCRKKVADYEANERMRFSQGSLQNGTCSTSSHSEDGNGNSKTTETPHEWNGNHYSGVPELESSLADFEEERLSIFEQIKVLEEKLFELSDEEDQHFADVRPIEDLYEENGFHSDDIVTKTNKFHSNELGNGKKRMDIEGEVYQVYERLHALEADREFLKHCVGSLNKGEKGMELLREILQHLRDLRTMDFQT